MLLFRDPHDGRLVWQFPGGGVEAGESPLEAARRELSEESGLSGASVIDRPVELWRSFSWNGRNHHQPEHFYLARVSAAALDLSQLAPEETENLSGHRWWTPEELRRTSDSFEPQNPGEIAARLGAPSPWDSERRIPPELLTERMLLRQWRPEDLDPLFEIYQQPEFLAHMPTLDLNGTREQIERFAQRWQDDGFCQWAAVDLDSGNLIGRIGLIRHHDWPVVADPVEVGWTLHRAYWGRGLATEGGRAAIECWRDLLPDEQLISITRPANGRSRAVMERLGLTYRGAAAWRGSDVVWYAVDR